MNKSFKIKNKSKNVFDNEIILKKYINRKYREYISKFYVIIFGNSNKGQFKIY